MDEILSNDHLTTLATNGLIGLVIVIVLIKQFSKAFGAFMNLLVTTLGTAIKDASTAEVAELRELRRSIDDNTKAHHNLTDRVSRVEGKIEGIVFARSPEMSDELEHTPIGPIPQWDPGEHTPTALPPITAQKRAQTLGRSTPGKGVSTSGYGPMRPGTKRER